MSDQPSPTPAPTPTPGAPEGTPPTSGSPTPTGTPPEPSPAGDPPAGDPPAGDPPSPEPKPEPTPEDLAAQARAVVPESADAYQVNLDEAGREALGLTDGDPLVEGLRKYAHEKGKPQGYVDDVLEAAAEMARAGLFDAGLDPAAEAAALGENAEGRRREVEVFGQALKARGDITEAEYGELMSLAPTAAGVTLIEKLRKMMTDNGQIKPPGDAPSPEDAAKEEARNLAKDPKYGKDRAFTAEADRKWAAAFGGRV